MGPATTTILRLPNELLLHIFQAFVRRHTLDSITLSHVCRRWRSLSVGVAQLWSSIGVHAHEDPDSIGIEEMTKLYLERSGSFLLDVFVDVPAPALFLILGQHSSRWSSLHLRVEDNFFRPTTSSALLSQIRNHLPLLDELILEDSNGVVISALEFFNKAPRLNVLNIDAQSLDICSASFTWANLHAVSINGVYSSEVVFILSSGQQLQTARFTGVMFHWGKGWDVGDGSISRPALTTLALTLDTEDDDDPNIENVLCTFHFPHLTVFELSSSKCASSGLPLFLLRSSNDLRHLKLSGLDNLPKDTLLDLLQKCPVLEVLDLRDEPAEHNIAMISNITSRVLQGLTLEDASSTMLPCLTRLYFTLPCSDLYGLGMDDLRMIVKLISSRRNRWGSNDLNSARLISIDLGPHWRSLYPDEFKQELQVFETEGLVVL